LDLIFECALFIFGLVFGSFLNVCISRIPGDQSVVAPGSHCPACGAAIRWRDNIPVLSWLTLRGRCRDCRMRIPFRYPAVELLTALLFAMCFGWFGPSWLTFKMCVFCFLLVGLIFMDGETGLLPHEFTYPGIMLGLGLSWLVPTDSSGTQFWLRIYGVHLSPVRLSLLDSAIGAFVGAGFLYLAWALYYLVRRRHGMGFGDIALMAMSGAFLGLKLTVFVLFSATVSATIYSVVILARHARHRSAAVENEDVAPGISMREMLVAGEIPFGVFLGACSLVAVFFGQTIWRWYLSFFR
jgi:leader peptidase (prepilin peptidase)/N-methyltransferase